jgi:predicted acetyltransferase
LASQIVWPEALWLIEPAESWRAAFLDYLADYERAGEMGIVERHRKWVDDLAGFVERCRRNARGLDLPEGWAPYSAYWGIVGDRVVGTIGLST